jgi:ubiquinone/menaquinone biosynthesis C-methylase UbiE
MHPAFICNGSDDLIKKTGALSRNCALKRSSARMKPDNNSRPEKIRHKDLPLAAAWDEAYEKQGRLWGGAPPRLPDLPEHSRILELGCGSGKLLRALAGRPYGIVALDFSKHACRLARNAAAGSENVDVIAADVRSIPARDTSFDAVLACHVAGHVLQEDRELLAGECARVLRPGGRLSFTGFSTADFRAGEGTEVEKNTYLRKNGILTHFFSEQEVQNLFRPFTLRKITTRSWSLKVRGKEHPRAEIIAEFVKNNQNNAGLTGIS